MKKANASILLTASFLIISLLSGCARKTPEDLLPDSEILPASETVSETEAAAPMLFPSASADESCKGLYHMPFEIPEKGYSEGVCRFGDRVLFISSLPLSDSKAEQDGEDEDNGEDWEGDLMTCYCFSLYDPLEDQIVASLNTEAFDCIFFQVLRDELCLEVLKEGETELQIYDQDLKYVRSLDESFCEDHSSLFYPAADGRLYASNYEEGTVTRLNPSDMAWTEEDYGLYHASPNAISSDGEYLAVSGTNRRSLKDIGIVVRCSDNQKVADTCNLYSESLNDHLAAGIYSYFDGIGVCQRYGQDPLYFYMDGLDRVELLSEDRLLLTQDDWEDTGDESSSVRNSFHLYRPGIGIEASLSFQSEYTIPERTAYLEEADCLLWVCDSDLMIWKLKEAEPATARPIPENTDPGILLTKAMSSEEFEQRSLSGDLVTMLADPDSYDWGELAGVRSYAKELEQKYGVKIYLGPEIPPALSDYNAQAEMNPETLQDSLQLLDQIFGRYPHNFFPQLSFGRLQGAHIYLTGPLSQEGDDIVNVPAAYVSERNDYLMVVADCQYSYNWEYSLNHELSHTIDRRLAYQASLTDFAVFNEDTWAALNPEDYNYLYTYAGYEYNQNYYDYMDYFYDSYGTTFPTEDRAQIFGYTMESVESGDYMGMFTYDSPFNRKMTYYSRAIRDGFDTEGWPEQLPWESVLYLAE